MLVEDYLRPAAVKAGVIAEGDPCRFRIPQSAAFPGIVSGPHQDDSHVSHVG
jgi:hypothetical protein